MFLLCTSRLKDEYEKVSEALDEKLRLSEGALQKGGLQNEANRLANNVNDKLKELQGMSLLAFSCSYFWQSKL